MFTYLKKLQHSLFQSYVKCNFSRMNLKVLPLKLQFQNKIQTSPWEIEQQNLTKSHSFIHEKSSSEPIINPYDSEVKLCEYMSKLKKEFKLIDK